MGELQIPVSGHAKRVFFLVVGGSLALIVLVRFLLIPVIFDTPFPSVAEVLNESLGDVFATVVAATVLGAVVVWASAPSAKRTDLHVLHPRDIGRTLEQALVGARSWHYDGSTGPMESFECPTCTGCGRKADELNPLVPPNHHGSPK